MKAALEKWKLLHFLGIIDRMDGMLAKTMHPNLNKRFREMCHRKFEIISRSWFKKKVCAQKICKKKKFIRQEQR